MGILNAPGNCKWVTRNPSITADGGLTPATSISPTTGLNVSFGSTGPTDSYGCSASGGGANRYSGYKNCDNSIVASGNGWAKLIFQPGCSSDIPQLYYGGVNYPSSGGQVYFDALPATSDYYLACSNYTGTAIAKMRVYVGSVVNGVCGATYNSCSAGTPSGGVVTCGGVSTWNCDGSGTGHMDATCSVASPTCTWNFLPSGPGYSGEPHCPTVGANNPGDPCMTSGQWCCVTPSCTSAMPQAVCEPGIPGPPPPPTPCPLPWGGSIPDGASVPAYSSPTAPDCSTVDEIRTCAAGVLSGSFTHQTCAPVACAGSWTWDGAAWTADPGPVPSCAAPALPWSLTGGPTTRNCCTDAEWHWAYYSAGTDSSCPVGEDFGYTHNGDGTNLTGTCKRDGGGVVILETGDGCAGYMGDNPSVPCTITGGSWDVNGCFTGINISTSYQCWVW
jgi:hypothetical protein